MHFSTISYYGLSTIQYYVQVIVVIVKTDSSRSKPHITCITTPSVVYQTHIKLITAKYENNLAASKLEVIKSGSEQGVLYHHLYG
jgi:hypothetical protein